MAASIFITSKGRTPNTTPDDVFIIKFEGNAPVSADIVILWVLGKMSNWSDGSVGS